MGRLSEIFTFYGNVQEWGIGSGRWEERVVLLTQSFREGDVLQVEYHGNGPVHCMHYAPLDLLEALRSGADRFESNFVFKAHDERLLFGANVLPALKGRGIGFDARVLHGPATEYADAFP